MQSFEVNFAALMAWLTLALKLPWVSSTPFGFPEVPDVYNRVATSSGVGRVGKMPFQRRRGRSSKKIVRTPGGGGPNISTIGRTVTQASAPLSAKMWARSSSETKKLRGTTRRPVLQMPNMASGARPDVGSMKAVAEEHPNASSCLAKEALPASNSIFFQDR